MALLFKDGRPVVRLRAFRAIDDPATCERFIEGHARVLTAIGVKKVTSSKDEWMYNPAAFVLIVESLDGENVYGGARVHVAGGTQPLPIEEATGNMDPKIFDLVWAYARHGTGEVCGLWNSREIAGYGVGSIFLTRAAVAISSQVGLRSLFALCAPYTVAMAQSVGYQLETSVGNNGTFYYPKLDLLATTLILQDVKELSVADEEERNAIFQMRNQVNLTAIEKLRRREIEIEYKLELPNMEQWDLKGLIESLHGNLPRPNIDHSDGINFF
ncbi:hypothetical protein [Sphingobacterium griseoflavum]|uniref:N-acetyltransferase domain-containing protein n=1 Tax=Sphingobacterium griseoflavum TaxID=1474952 RepID=A0ABQ3HXL5_9SPHI|nr:hypothetical protein [Sphingobacterium griseoflavum]GHE33236.1 hypothetical protein GCM10017764_15400 [Sphingobacterium griseoflavum]